MKTTQIHTRPVVDLVQDSVMFCEVTDENYPNRLTQGQVVDLVQDSVMFCDVTEDSVMVCDVTDDSVMFCDVIDENYPKPDSHKVRLSILYKIV